MNEGFCSGKGDRETKFRDGFQMEESCFGDMSYMTVKRVDDDAQVFHFREGMLKYPGMENCQ